MAVEIHLTNPKRFLPLLLFAGLVFALIGSVTPTMTPMQITGLLLIAVATILWVLKNRNKIGL